VAGLLPGVDGDAAGGAVRRIAVVLVAALAVSSALPAVAQEGRWSIGARVLGIVPDYDSGTIATTGSQLEVGSGIGAELSGTYRLSARLGFELSAAALPLDLTTVNGQYPGLDAGSVDVLTGMFAARYSFATTGRFKPYLGLGMAFAHPLRYAISQDLIGAGISDLGFTTSLRLYTQVGAGYTIGKGWYLNADLRYVPLTTRVDFKLAAGGSLDVVSLSINPILVGLGVGRTF
jgi:outer membrane protein